MTETIRRKTIEKKIDSMRGELNGIQENLNGITIISLTSRDEIMTKEDEINTRWKCQ